MQGLISLVKLKKIICLLDPEDSKIIKKFRLMGTWSDNDGMFDRKNVENLINIRFKSNTLLFLIIS